VGKIRAPILLELHKSISIW